MLLLPGEYVSLLFPDGFVKKLQSREGRLIEENLSFADMAKIRIEDAHARLKRFAELSDEDRTKAVYAVLSGMAELICVTLADRDGGQEIRRQIIKDFFLELQQDHLNLIHRKLTAILHQVDSALVPMLRQESPAVTVDLSVLASKFRVTGKTERTRNSPTAGKNPTNVGNPRPKGPTRDKPGRQSNPEKSKKRARKAAQRK